MLRKKKRRLRNGKKKDRKGNVVNHSLLTLNLPLWLEKFLSGAKSAYPTIEDRMRFVIELSRLNVGHGTGGPFGAAVFDMRDGSLCAPGVNLVLATNCSVLHAEVVALILAQHKAGLFDLSAEGTASYELVTSTEPCAMCFGAVQWSGIRRLVCGARGEDAERIGFDEGEKSSAWVEGLERRGISVVRDVCRNEAVAVLREYLESGGTIYNPRR
jgi:tRNA(Arg) A34 adenosine deaminase TadA